MIERVIEEVSEISLLLYDCNSNVGLESVSVYKLAPYKVCISKWYQVIGDADFDDELLTSKSALMKCVEYVKEVGRKTLYGFVMMCYIAANLTGDAIRKMEVKIQTAIVKSHPRIVNYKNYHEFVMNAYTLTHSRNHESGLHALIYDYILHWPKVVVDSIFDHVRVYSHMFHWRHESLLGHNFQRLARELYDVPTVVFMYWLAWRYFTTDRNWISEKMREIWMGIATGAGFNHGQDTENRFVVGYFNSHLGCELDDNFDMLTHKRFDIPGGFIATTVWDHSTRDTDYQVFFVELESKWKSNGPYLSEVVAAFNDSKKFGEEAAVFATNHIGELHIIAVTFWMYVFRHESMIDLVRHIVGSTFEQVEKMVENIENTNRLLISVGGKPHSSENEREEEEEEEEQEEETEEEENQEKDYDREDIIRIGGNFINQIKEAIKKETAAADALNVEIQKKNERILRFESDTQKTMTDLKNDWNEKEISQQLETIANKINTTKIETQKYLNAKKNLETQSLEFKQKIAAILDLPSNIRKYMPSISKGSKLALFYDDKHMNLLVDKPTNQNAGSFKVESLRELFAE